MRSLGREDVVDIWYPEIQKDSFFVTMLPDQAYWLFFVFIIEVSATTRRNF